VPRTSLELVELLSASTADAVVDVGCGASSLAEHLVKSGYSDVTVLDVSGCALALAKEQIGGNDSVTRVQADLLAWRPTRRFDLWHDRAVFHFLVDEEDREQYRAVLRMALKPGGAVIVGTFAADGPEFCSGLPVARYSGDQLARAFGPDLLVVEERREDHTTPDGTVQPFTWLAARLKDDAGARSGDG